MTLTRRIMLYLTQSRYRFAAAYERWVYDLPIWFPDANMVVFSIVILSAFMGLYLCLQLALPKQTVEASCIS
jgi:hypothetical protein